MMHAVRMLAALVIACAVLGTSRADAQASRPNIIVIVADDMGYADLGVHGSADAKTPNLDSLAARGVRFTDAYVSGPYCSPTRAGLLTGRYPQRFGHEFNIGGGMHRDVGLPLEERTLADRLKAAGYRTALVGKWHLGTAPQFHPMQRGFDEFFGFLGGAHPYMRQRRGNPAPLLDGTRTVSDTGYLTDRFTDRAVDFIRRQRPEQPFFLYLAFNAVHTPLQATRKYLDRFAHVPDQRRRTYLAMLSAMDDGIGRTIAALREQKLDDNTLIFFFSDNGGPVGDGAGNGSSNMPLRGRKMSTWEGGIRVPFIISWKGRIPEGKTDSRPIIQLDVAPTALAAAGAQIDSAWKPDGVDLLPFLTGRNAAAPHDVLYWRLGSIMAVRMGDWKLVKMHAGPPDDDVTVLNDLTGAELYNLRQDIGETKNVAAANPNRVKRLGETWLRWHREMSKPKWDRPDRAQRRRRGR